MKVNENEWKREDKVEIAEGWNTTRYRNTYDPLGEVFFFAAGPFFKPPVFLAPAFAFGRGLLRERSSSFLSPTSALGVAHYRYPPGPGHPPGQGKTQ